MFCACRALILITKKQVLGDTCSRLVSRNARMRAQTSIFTTANQSSLGQLASQTSWPSSMPLGLQNHCLGSRARVIYIRNQHFLAQIAQARPVWPKPDPGQILEIWEPGNPEIWNPKKISKNRNSQNLNPCHLTCRRGLDWPEEDPPSPMWCHPKSFSMGQTKPKNAKTIPISLGGLVGQGVTECPLIASLTAGT